MNLQNDLEETRKSLELFKLNTESLDRVEQHAKDHTQFNKLTNSEAERLYLLLEELGEAQQVIGKILRHGYDSYHPQDENKCSNRGLLEKELGDIFGAIYLMRKTGDVDQMTINRCMEEKLERVQKFLHHNEVPVET